MRTYKDPAFREPAVGKDCAIRPAQECDRSTRELRILTGRLLGSREMNSSWEK